MDAKGGDRTRLMQEALLAMRAARLRIDPAMLDKARQAIAAQISQGAQTADEAPAPVTDADTRIDRAKNMSTVMKFLQLNSENKDINRQVLALLRSPKGQNPKD